MQQSVGVPVQSWRHQCTLEDAVMSMRDRWRYGWEYVAAELKVTEAEERLVRMLVLGTKR